MSIVLPIRKRFILDKIPKSLVVAAYSTMRLTKEYNGACVRVRRSSDNAEKNIYFNFENLLNFSDFVGFNGAYVRTWYDQSGQGNHAQQPTAANQPSCGFDMGGTPPVNPRIRWTSSSRWLIPDNVNNDFDILNGPLCLLVTFESTLTGVGFLLAKNLDATTNMQYGFAHDGSNLRITSYLENSASYSDNGSVPKGAAVWNKAIFNWDGQKIDRYNNAQFLNQTNHAVTLTSRPNITIGARASATGVTSGFLGGIRTMILLRGLLTQNQINEIQGMLHV